MKNNINKDNIFESLNDPSKSNWSAKPLVYVGGFFLFLSLLSLFRLNFNFLIGFFILGILFSYIGYRIQVRSSIKNLKVIIESEAEKIKVVSDDQLKNKAIEITDFVIKKSKIMIDNYDISLKKKNIVKINSEIKYKSFIEVVLLSLHLIDEMVVDVFKDEKLADKFVSYSLNCLIERIDTSKKTIDYIPNFSKIVIPSYKRNQKKYRNGEWNQTMEKRMLLLNIKIGILCNIPKAQIENSKELNIQFLDDLMSLYEDSWASLKKIKTNV